MPLDVVGVSKVFGATRALSDVNFEVRPKSLCGLVGTNGAGKSTLLDVIGGLSEPSTGSVTVDGVATGTPAGRSLLGVVPDIPELIEGINGVELLVHVGIMRGLCAASARSRATEVAGLVGVPQDSRPISIYSTGNRKRVAIAAAQMVPPTAQVLDEPLESIDPLAAERIVSSWRTYCANGGLVLLSTHDLRLASEVCDRILVMAQGRIVEDFTDGADSDVLLDALRSHDTRRS